MKIIYFILGMISFIFGAIGVVLPILPTTPFLLAAAFFFAKSSQKINNWFLSTKLYQSHLESFIQERSMTLKTKVTILLFASIMLMFPLILVNNIFVRLLIIFLYVFKYYYFIYRIKTIQQKEI